MTSSRKFRHLVSSEQRPAVRNARSVMGLAIACGLFGLMSVSSLLAEGVDQNRPVTPILRVEPNYPDAALDTCAIGHVVVRFTVREDSMLEGVQFLESEPPGLFDMEVREILSYWQFQPALKDGAPVSTRVEQRFDFQPPAECVPLQPGSQ